jgi:hypothetical protein
MEDSELIDRYENKQCEICRECVESRWIANYRR